jgi:hypothetical protein
MLELVGKSEFLEEKTAGPEKRRSKEMEKHEIIT